MIYRILITHESGNPDLKTSETRRRADSAENRAYALAHAHLKGNSFFGTPLSGRVMREVGALDARKGGTVDMGHGYRLYLTPSRN